MIVKKVDVTSFDALTDVLKGQDAVVSTITTGAVNNQRLIIDAAVAARVKRFLPSEFGLDTQRARGTKAGNVMKPKVECVNYLIELSEKYDWFTWTSLSTGSFFDWVR